MRDLGRAITDCDAVAAHGGPLRPVPGGVYRVNEAMLADARSEEFLEHVSKLGCVIADNLCRGTGVPCFIVDPVSTDEFADISRLSGLKELPRKCLTHALSVKQAARHYARKLGRPYESLNLITAHVGGGVSIAVHCQGRNDRLGGRQRRGAILSRAQRRPPRRQPRPHGSPERARFRGRQGHAHAPGRPDEPLGHHRRPRRSRSGFAAATPTPDWCTRQWPMAWPNTSAPWRRRSAASWTACS